MHIQDELCYTTGTCGNTLFDKKNRMNIRVLMFGWEFPPHNSGGLGTACAGLAKALTLEPISLTFVLPKEIKGIDASFLRMIFANMKTLRFRGVETSLFPYVDVESYADYVRKMPDEAVYGLDLFAEVRRYGLKARDIAEDEEFDIIHAHDWLSFRAGIEAKKVSGKPLVVHVHATEFDRTAGHPNQYIYEEEKVGMQMADRVIAISRLTRDTIVQHYGIDPAKITVVHNGIDHEQWNKWVPSTLEHLKSQGKKIVLFVGRITIQKGPDYFIRVAKRVIDQDKNVIFVVSGSGDMETQMIRLSAELGIGNNVLFAGFARGDDLTRLYRAADLYVMPSVSEPFGLTPLEALVNGTPVLISKQSGVAEVVSHALKSNFWDVDDMADKILGIVHSDVLRETLKEHGSREVNQVTWTNAAKSCVDVYRQVLSANAPQ